MMCSFWVGIQMPLISYKNRLYRSCCLLEDNDLMYYLVRFLLFLFRIDNLVMHLSKFSCQKSVCYKRLKLDLRLFDHLLSNGHCRLFNLVQMVLDLQLIKPLLYLHLFIYSCLTRSQGVKIYKMMQKVMRCPKSSRHSDSLFQNFPLFLLNLFIELKDFRPFSFMGDVHNFLRPHLYSFFLSEVFRYLHTFLFDLLNFFSNLFIFYFIF